MCYGGWLQLPLFFFSSLFMCLGGGVAFPQGFEKEKFQ
jgi:hypothetical protein